MRRSSIEFLALLSGILMATAMEAANTSAIPVHVGVVVDLDEPISKMYLSCIQMALSDFYAIHDRYKTRLVLNTRDSNGSVVGAAAAAYDLIKNVEVKAILGPVTSMQANFVVNLGDDAHVPIISFSATSPVLTSLGSSYFFLFAQNDLNQVKAISGVIEYFRWRRVVPIYVDNVYGQGVIPFLIDALQAVDAHIPYRSLISQTATSDQIEKELYKLKTMQTRVFVVHMMPNLSYRLFAKAKEIGMMTEGYVWITTNNGIGSNLKSMASDDLDSMQGLLGVETDIPRTLKQREFISRWKRQFLQNNSNIIDLELDTFGFRAYDATFALAMALEKVANDTFEVPQYGSKLCDALSATRFKGMAGDFRLVDRQLQVSTFKIVNVIGDGARTVGYWTTENGMVVKGLNRPISGKKDLGPIIWPGDSFSVPKGWEIPAENGTKLRIGVPVKDGTGFREFVKITKDPSTNTIEVTGFSIEVFKATVAMLPYALPYDLIPFAKPDGTSAGTYNELVYQVFLGKFDAAVGDITIRSNRTLHVDFTMPYTESGIVMVVPIVDTRKKNAWVFLRPLTWDLWLTTFCFFIFVGFVIWVLEHRINDDFRGPPSYQVGTSFWFSFSTMVFSQREKVVSNLGRFVMIVWIFVVLIVTQSYTANLASLLTVQQLIPTVTDMNDLQINGDYIGYMRDSYVYDLLKQRFPDESKLKPYGDMEEIDKALSMGSGKGGIAAIIHETPYMKFFMAKYRSKYTMVGPIFRTDGFGFAFPKGSPLTPDVSQALLNLTEGEKMLKIEDKWLNKDSSCKDLSNEKFGKLGLESFGGLFIIAGVASVLALIIFIATFLYKHRHVLNPPNNSSASKWKRVRTMFEVFNEKDLSSRTTKTSRGDRNICRECEVKFSPNDNLSENALNYTNHTEPSNSSFLGQESPEIVPRFEVAIKNQEMHETRGTAQEKY